MDHPTDNVLFTFVGTFSGLVKKKITNLCRSYKFIEFKEWPVFKVLINYNYIIINYNYQYGQYLYI